MLLNIPKSISPDLLKILAEMGHGDEIAIVDSNFPAKSLKERTIYSSKESVLNILRDILKIFPLDQFSERNIFIMKSDNGEVTKFYKQYLREFIELEKFSQEINRDTFYERAKESYAIVSTNDESLYGCLIIRKGIVSEYYK